MLHTTFSVSLKMEMDKVVIDKVGINKVGRYQTDTLIDIDSVAKYYMHKALLHCLCTRSHFGVVVGGSAIRTTAWGHK